MGRVGRRSSATIIPVFSRAGWEPVQQPALPTESASLPSTQKKSTLLAKAARSGAPQIHFLGQAAPGCVPESVILITPLSDPLCWC
jgi:hypothetical protein